METGSPKGLSRAALNPRSGANLKVAVVIHLFYEDQWDEFEEELKNFDVEISLFVTLRPESSFASQIRRSFPDASVSPVPNLGRDVAPFLALLPQLQAFDVVCKLHTKRSERGHTSWRRSLVKNLIGSSDTINAYLEAFAAEPGLVLAGPRDHYLDGSTYATDSRKALAMQFGPLDGYCGFFAGTMFWCRPKAYADLTEMYPQACFVAHNDSDGQPEHVVERAFGYLANLQNKKIMLWDGEVQIAEASSLRGASDIDLIYGRAGEVDADFDQVDGEIANSNQPTLYDVHLEHDGFVSDKWTGNLIHYERLLKDFRDRDLRMLEIGVQNGGSLQIWSKYFQNGRKFLGCDIDPACGKLDFDDPRVSVIVSDAGAPIAKTLTMRVCGQFDLIIDDGSHMSGDIIRAFLSFFPTLVHDGLFVIEDMSCSFWKEFEGGLDHETSSLAFFKEIANIINMEHWQSEADINSRFERFIKAYDLDFDASVLKPIQSIEILNSMVVVRKGTQAQTHLGRRMVHGKIARITGAGVLLDGTYCVPPGVARPDRNSEPLESDEPSDMAISVVIPFFNGSAYLQEAIRSVEAQTLPAREIIVVNDGSNDRETRWLEDLSRQENFILISQENTGQGGARNTGAKAARGTHLCFLDQDDTFLPHHNEVLAGCWRENFKTSPSLGWVFADVAQVDQNLNVIGPRSFPHVDVPVLRKPNEFISRDAMMFPSAALICREKFLAVDGFDPALRGYEDDDLYLRLLLDGNSTSFCPVAVTNWRRHPAQTSNQTVFIRSAEHFFFKWFGYDWGDPEEGALADARLKSRMVQSLSIHLNDDNSHDRHTIWQLFTAVQDARSPHRPAGKSSEVRTSNRGIRP